MFLRRLPYAALFVVITSTALAAPSPFQNLDAVANAAGFPAYARVRSARKVKVAILDNGFRGYHSEIGRTLPLRTAYHPGPVVIDPEREEVHGRYMAQILAGLLAKAPGIDYELHLFSAYGYSNLEAAINHVLKARFDIVLYSQIWEYGGNGDGRGFINTLVNRALNANILWVNAAGNFASGTYQGRVVVVADDWVKLPSPNNVVRVRCTAAVGKKCGLRAVLSWNDFKDDVKAGTSKDLDLIVTDDTLKIVASAALQQVEKTPPEPNPVTSLYPREVVQAELKPGTYFLRVKARSANFDPSHDQLRITVSGNQIRLLDSTKGETLLPPADNPRVITVGASDFEESSNSVAFHKPELLTDSHLRLANGDQYKGSSNSAAIAAAALAVLRATRNDFTREQALRLLHSENGDVGRGLDIKLLQFTATGPGCFVTSVIPFSSHALVTRVQWLNNHGAQVVMSSAGLKIFLPMDPFSLTGTARVAVDYMLVASATGLSPRPRSAQMTLPFGQYEVVQQPNAQSVCGAGGGSLRLPSPAPQARN